MSRDPSVRVPSTWFRFMKARIIYFVMLCLASCSSPKLAEVKAGGEKLPLAPFALKKGMHLEEKWVADGVWNQWSERISAPGYTAMYAKKEKDCTCSFNVQMDADHHVLEQVTRVFINSKKGTFELKRYDWNADPWAELEKHLPQAARGRPRQGSADR